LKRILLWLIVAGVILVTAFVLYRHRSVSDLNVTPYARDVIDKAKRR
jgi:hypothetical protein